MTALVLPTRFALVDLCETFADGDWIESKDQSRTGIRLIQTGNIGIGHFKTRDQKARYISGATFARLRCSEVFPGDCLISRLPDPVGRACIIPQTNERMVTAVDCTILQFRSSELLPDYFGYYAQSDQYFHDVASMTTGTTRTRISRTNLGQVRVPAPPIPEQQRIVGILDKAFENIAISKTNTEKNIVNARELFKTELQFIFSQRGGEWPVKPLESICAFRNGFAFKSALFTAQGEPILRISNIQNGVIDSEHCVYFKRQDYKENLDRYRVEEGDLLIAMSGATTGKLGFNQTSHCFYLNQRVGKFEPKPVLEKRFLYYYLLTRVEANLSMSAGAAQPNLSTEQIKAFRIPLPSVSEQNIVVSILDNISSTATDLEATYKRKTTRIEALKQSLLHAAFNGQL